MARRRTPGLRKRGQYWHIQKVIRGYGTLHESTGETDLPKAEIYLAKRLEEIRRVVIYGERPRVTFEKAAKRYLQEECPTKSLERAGIALDRVLPFIGRMELDEIYDDTLAPFKKAREAAGIAAGTINKELGYVRRILILAARKWRTAGEKWLLEAPLISMVAGQRRRPYPLEWVEQRRLFSLLRPHQAQMALFAVNTGVRQGELVALRWSWEVNVPELDTSVFLISGAFTKNGDDRVIVLNEIARRVVERERGRHPEFVFTYKGKPVKRLNTSAFRKAREAAGVGDCRVHDLRHTFGYRLRAAGVSLEDREDLLGHRSGRMTTHYSAPDLARLIEAVNRICKVKQATILRLVGQKSGSSVVRKVTDGS
jgi:integrase